MSAQKCYGRNGVVANTRQIPLSMPSAPSRMAASKLASVFSGNLADALNDGQHTLMQLGVSVCSLHGDPSNLEREVYVLAKATGFKS